jgi:hypothetical protein
MPKPKSEGQCTLCQQTFAKAGMTKHLGLCRQNNEVKSKLPKTKLFLLLVEGAESPEYWLHLELPATTTFQKLDRFLRDIWLECCGHLSKFDIAGKSRSLEEVIESGMEFSYQYDFGSTTELSLKVVSEYQASPRGVGIQILARNLPLQIPCDKCGKMATQVCTECIYDDRGWLCETCVKKHKCDEDMLLPVVNSPRVGVCGYMGEE